MFLIWVLQRVLKKCKTFYLFLQIKNLQPRKGYRNYWDYSESLWKYHGKNSIIQFSLGCSFYIRLLLLYMERDCDQESD